MSLREEFEAAQRDYDAEAERHEKAVELLTERISQIRTQLEHGDTTEDHLLDGIVRHLWGGFERLEFLMSKCRDLEAKLTGKTGQFILLVHITEEPTVHYDFAHQQGLIPPRPMQTKKTISLGVLTGDRLDFDAQNGRPGFSCESYVFRLAHETPVLKPGPLLLSTEEMYVALAGAALTGSRLRIEIVAGDQEVLAVAQKYHLRPCDLVTFARLLKRPLEQVPALAEEFGRLQAQYLEQLAKQLADFEGDIKRVFDRNRHDNSEQTAQWARNAQHQLTNLEQRLTQAVELDLDGHEQVVKVRERLAAVKSLIAA